MNKVLDLGSTYMFEEEEEAIVIEVNNDGDFCYVPGSNYEHYDEPKPNTVQLLVDYKDGIPVPDEYFDYAAGSCFLEEVTYEEQLRAFKELFRVLKTDARVKVKGCDPLEEFHVRAAIDAGFEIVEDARPGYLEEDGKYYYDDAFIFRKKG